MNKEIFYIFIEEIPVKRLITREAGEQISIFDYDSLQFKPASPYHIDEIHLGRNAEMEPVSKEEFIDQVETLRAERYQKEDELGALYSQMKSIELNAESAGRSLTDEERHQLSEIRKRTHVMFEKMYPATS